MSSQRSRKNSRIRSTREDTDIILSCRRQSHFQMLQRTNDIRNRPTGNHIEDFSDNLCEQDFRKLGEGEKVTVFWEELIAIPVIIHSFFHCVFLWLLLCAEHYAGHGPTVVSKSNKFSGLTDLILWEEIRHKVTTKSQHKNREAVTVEVKEEESRVE